MPQRLVIIGAGGHGREIADVVDAVGGYELVGFLDEGTPDPGPLAERDLSLLGKVDELDLLGEVAVVLAIGDPWIRMRIADRVHALRGDHFPVDPLVHPLASVGSRCRIAPGTVIAAGARLTTNIEVGRHCYVGPNATIGHDTVLLDGATLYPNATVSGNVTIGRAATVGAGAAVKQGVKVGAGSFVALAAGAVHDVPEGVTVAGTPARRLGSR